MKWMVQIATAAALATTAPTAALAASKVIEAEPFTEIEISSGIRATIEVGETQSVIAESPDAAQLEELIVEVRGGRFHAYIDWSVFDLFSLGADRRISLTITVPTVEVIEANSGSGVVASGIEADRLGLNASSGANLTVRDVAAGTVEAEASSGADLDVAGTCDTAKIESSSGADLDAGSLVCRTVDVEASSGAHAKVHATDSVEADASSGASVTVGGTPRDVRSDESSGGDVSISG